MADSVYNKQVNSKNSVNLSNFSFSSSNIAGYHKSVGSGTSSGVGTSMTSSITLNLDDMLTDNLDETVTAEEIKNPKAEETKKGFFENLGDTLKSTGATVAVGATSILSGVLDIGEAILDGGTWALSKVVGLFSSDTEEALKEFIARDLVSEANEAFYENTELGRSINDASYMKYDSETAQGIRSATTTATEIAAATALTIATGGAAPLVVGTMVGLGEASETVYQNNGTDTTFLQELSIAGSGALTGLSWMANGKLGAGAINIIKDCCALGTKNVISGILTEMKSSEFWKKAGKETLSLINEKGKINIGAIMNYLTSAFSTAGTLTPYITGEEEFDLEALGKVVLTYAEFLTLNVFEDIVRGYISEYAISDEQAKLLASKIANGEENIGYLKQRGLSQASFYKVTDEVISNNLDAAGISPNSTESAIIDIMRRHDSKYGSGSASYQLQEFCNPNSPNYHNYNLISSYNGGRGMLMQYSPEEIEHAIKNINYNYGEIGNYSGHFTRYGSPADKTYGADQGGIERLCWYELNGRKYSYREATNAFNEAIAKGTPLPHFRKVATDEYIFLKNKLISQGFSDRDASVIMSTVNDAGACSYATVVNEIFSSYINNPSKFQQDFGYSMYIQNKKGEYIFNSNELLLDLYVYANQAQNGGRFINPDNTINKNWLSSKRDVLGKQLLIAKEQVYMSNYSEGKKTSIISNFLSSKGASYDSRWIANNSAKHQISNEIFDIIKANVKNELSQGHGVSLDIYSGGKEINIISTNRRLYGSTSTSSWKEGGGQSKISGHSMFITGMGSNCFYVSSWGEEYAIPFSDLQNGGMFNIFSAIIK